MSTKSRKPGGKKMRIKKEKGQANMNLPINWNNDSEVRRLFSWQTRIGLAPKFGTRPISWYQIHHRKVYDLLVKNGLHSGKARCKNGDVYVGCCYVGTANDLYDLADRLIRGA